MTELLMTIKVKTIGRAAAICGLKIDHGPVMPDVKRLTLGCVIFLAE